MVIGVVDDRDDEREEFVDLLELALEEQKPNCEVLSVRPFDDITDYARWINEAELAGVIIDENLKDKPGVQGKLTKYFGHEVAKEIRNTRKDLPIFMLAASPTFEGLTSDPGPYDRIIPRTDFADKFEEYTQAILRLCGSYLERNQNELKRLSELAKRMLEEDVTTQESEELQALQVRLAIPYYVAPNLKREEAIKKYANAVQEMQELVSRVESYLKKKNKK